MMHKAEVIKVKNWESPEVIFDELRRDLAEWMTTDRDLIWRPAIELTRGENSYTAQMLLPNVDAKDIDISMTAEMLLVEGTTRDGRKFLRSMKFPMPVDPDTVHAEFADGMLIVMMDTAAVKHDLPMLKAA